MLEVLDQVARVVAGRVQLDGSAGPASRQPKVLVVSRAARGTRKVLEVLGAGTGTDEPPPSLLAEKSPANTLAWTAIGVGAAIVVGSAAAQLFAVTTYQVGDLTLNAETLEVARAGTPIKLSRTVFEILKVLMREAPKVVTRETLERELWGDDLPDSDTLRSHLYNLRRSIDRPFDTALLETLSGQGYRLRVPDEPG